MTTATHIPYYQALERAKARAIKDRIGAHRNADGTWTVKGYTVVVTGPRAQDVRCECIAAQSGLICKHLAPVIFCRLHRLNGVSYRQPAPIVIAPSTAEEIALSEAIKGEVVHELVYGQVCGAGPLAEAFA